MQNYKVEVQGTRIIVTNPKGEIAEGYVTESGSWGAKLKNAYLALKVANKHININEAIKEANK